MMPLRPRMAMAMLMQPNEAKSKVEELMGRRDAVHAEIRRAKAEYEKFVEQNLRVEARETEADIARLRQRLHVIETELNKLRRFW